uniref:Uncharacterized protein n=1 Tax=Arundo donax TaxID=35708 RepID=A0A0A9GL05_ARUDO
MLSSTACPEQLYQVLGCGCSCKQDTAYGERSFHHGQTPPQHEME